MCAHYRQFVFHSPLHTYNKVIECVDYKSVSWVNWAGDSAGDPLAIFRVALPDEGAAFMPYLRSLLAPDEMERATRFHRPDDQLRFGCARGLLRILLGQYTNQPPDRIEFTAGVNQKPELNGAVGWQFNVSHSADLVLIAIGKVRVGVDLEWVNPDFSFRDVLPVSFSPDEQHYIDACSDARSCFYRLWTRKEALVKATAKGMDGAFDRVPSLPGIHPANAQVIGQDGHWTVHSFAVADGYPAAVAFDNLIPVTPRFYTLRAEWLTNFG